MLRYASGSGYALNTISYVTFYLTLLKVWFLQRAYVASVAASGFLEKNRDIKMPSSYKR